jgi:hypothetical protein
VKDEVQPPINLKNSDDVRDWLNIVTLDERFPRSSWAYSDDHGFVQRVTLLLRDHRACGQELIDGAVDALNEERRQPESERSGFPALRIAHLSSLLWAAEMKLHKSILEVALEQCLLILHSAKKLGDALEEWETDRLPRLNRIGLSIAIVTASAAFVMGVILPIISRPPWVVYAGIPAGIYAGSLIVVVILAINVGVLRR